ncbi:MAG: tetraacyldisaccharide 4'-kinase [Alphaproteobacteria bacterium]|nr:tetraacyldisaccharide 4'-kinase [Alphaproteobacteria bacterium]OJV11924.1 MAG: tetraacyldisaccharide 4'-kinase [Alphaproteobacteria bacterium 33-17]
MKLKLKTPKFWKTKNLISLILWPLSILYFIGFIIDKYTSRKVQANIFTIGVGNLNAGGSGKTPVCMWIARILDKYKLNFAVITKGYGGKLKGPLIVSDSMTHSQVGDESLMYALSNFPTIASKNKAKGALYAKMHGIKAVIVDDALQSHKLTIDFKVLVIDSDYGYGNGFMLPAGPMRQPVLSTYDEANAIIVIGNGCFSIPSEYAHKVYEASIVPVKPKQNKYIAFCGIGIPEKFLKSLNSFELEIVEFIEFPDHYYYELNEIDEILLKARSSGSYVITTYKDWVRLNKKHQRAIEYLNVELKLYNEKELVKKIYAAIDYANS